MNRLGSLRRKAMAAGVAGLSLAGVMVATTGEASAWYDRYGRWHGGDRGGAAAAGVVGGLALGALAAGAANGGYGYGGPVYAAPPAPVYSGPECWYERQRVWDGYGWVMGRVRVCE